MNTVVVVIRGCRLIPRIKIVLYDVVALEVTYEKSAVPESVFNAGGRK